MVKSLYSGVSGLKTHQAKMDVIGNNIANVNTTGFKAGVVTFRDVYYQYKINPSAGTATTGGVNPAMVGYGVRLNSTTANMTNSGFTSSDWWADVALDGEGFFQVMDGAGNIYYTRAGKFDVDANGYLVNASGYHVLGVTGDSYEAEPSSEIIRIVVPATNDHASTATKRVNGTNVTLSVSAPSDNTDMTVTFNEADFPYATFNNGILNIFFDRNAQYTSQDDFEMAIATALQAGGVTLPDDVSLKFAFESIPDDYEPRAASNIVDDFKVSTQTSEYQYHTTYEEAGILKHAYMTFSVNDPTCRDKISITVKERPAGGTNIKEKATYTNGAWTLEVFEDSTAADINAAIKETINVAEKANQTISKINCDNLVLPAGEALRAETFKKMVMREPLNDGGAYRPMTVELAGGDKTGVTVDLEVQEVGEFGNNYKVVFSYQAGYGKTNAAWDENTLNITICADTTIADVNQVVKEAANGDKMKIIKFNDISGLDYGKDYDFDRTVVENNDGTYTITETDKNGVQRICTNANEASPAEITWNAWTTPDETPITQADFDAATAGDIVVTPNNDDTYRLIQTDRNGLQRICDEFPEEDPNPNEVAWDSYVFPANTDLGIDPGFPAGSTAVVTSTPNGDGTYRLVQTDTTAGGVTITRTCTSSRTETANADTEWDIWRTTADITANTDPGFIARGAEDIVATSNGDHTFKLTQTDGNGYQRIITNQATDATNPAPANWDKYVKPAGMLLETEPTPGFEDVKDKDDVWQVVFREAFFGGNPSVNPMDGKDSFFTETAKSLDTFALEDGRIGAEQTYEDLADIVIQLDGTIIGLHNVHGYITLGRIDIATFDNVNGLAQVSGTNFKETVASGPAKIKVAGTDGAGSVLSGSLEMSNVDLSQEFTDMITTQRGFQANSRVITVSDTMLEELLSLKR